VKLSIVTGDQTIMVRRRVDEKSPIMPILAACEFHVWANRCPDEWRATSMALSHSPKNHCVWRMYGARDFPPRCGGTLGADSEVCLHWFCNRLVPSFRVTIV